MFEIILVSILLAADKGPPAVELHSPCVPGETGSAMLREDGLALVPSDRFVGDRGEQLELWRSRDGQAWAAVVYLEDEDLRCLIAQHMQPAVQSSGRRSGI
jgi:hypothetical protein